MPLENRMHYSLLPGMLLLDKSGRNKPERLEGWKSKSSEETRSGCQDREEREIERGKGGKREEGRGRKEKKQGEGLEKETLVHDRHIE